MDADHAGALPDKNAAPPHKMLAQAANDMLHCVLRI
jgi:hypothetical protein